jgi:hypothetical protein
MADQRIKQLIRYWETLAANRSHWENTWQEVADNCIARRDFTVRRAKGQQRTVRIYDTTTRDAQKNLSAALHALLTNPATKWQEMRWQTAELNEVEEAVRYLELVKARVRHAFSKPTAGFSTEIHEVYNDLPSFGTACMYIADDPGFGARFMSRPLSEIYFDVDQSKNVKVVFRSFMLKAWQAVEFFGAELVPKAAAKVDSDPTKEFQFLHHVKQRGIPIPGRLDASGMAWESIYISMEDKSIISEGGFHENPYLIPRWEVDAGEIYGRCPGIDHLPDQKMLNSMWRTYIRTNEKAGDPPVLVDHDGVMPGSQVRITPNAQIVVLNDGTSREPVRYLENRAQLNFTVDLIETRSQKIEKGFHSEIIQAFRDPRMTATQFLGLQRLAQRLLSPVLGRIQPSLLDPMIKRVHGIESRRSDFPQPPPNLLALFQQFPELANLSIEYISPVARAQKASEAQAILDSFAAATAIAEAIPDVLDNIDGDAATRAIFEGNGVPIEILRRKDDVIVMREAQARIAETDRQNQMALEGGNTVAKLLPGIAQLNEAAGGAAP